MWCDVCVCVCVCCVCVCVCVCMVLCGVCGDISVVDRSARRRLEHTVVIGSSDLGEDVFTTL